MPRPTYLRYNSLTTIPEDLFKNLPKLERIYLSHNTLSKLPAKVFEGLGNLQWLYLDANSLFSLPENMFQELEQLERLSFDQNALTTLPAEVFLGLRGLQDLSLTNNPDLQCVPANVASTLDVDTISVDMCGCSPIEAVTCEVGVPCMPGEFGYTCSTAAPSPAPTPMPTGLPSPAPTSMPTRAKTPCLNPTSEAYKCNVNGTELELSYCGITDDDLGDVEGCLDVFGRATATRVFLRFNYLTNLPEDLFEGLGSLDRLYVNNNALNSLPAEVFQALGKLEILNLNGNALTSLSGSLFHGLGQLEHLWINDNLLTTLPAEIFDGLGQLISLDLRLNSDLQCVPANTATAVDVNELASGACGCSLTRPAACDAGQTCMPGEYGYTCATLAPTPAPVAPGNNTCLDPASEDYLCDTAGTEIDFSYCGLTDDSLDEVAACINVFGRDTVTHVYLRYNYLTAIPADLFEGCENLEHIYVNDNSLTTVPAEVLQGLGKLQVLNMNRNSLTALPGSLFQQQIVNSTTGFGQLHQLWLNQNSLTTLPAELFEELGSLEILDLRLNPDLQCIPNNVAVTQNVDDVSYDMCECTPSRAVTCGAGLGCVPGQFGYTCGV
ncbi:unnamed protein product [Pylaiella littoralis]